METIQSGALCNFLSHVIATELGIRAKRKTRTFIDKKKTNIINVIRINRLINNLQTDNYKDVTGVAPVTSAL